MGILDSLNNPEVMQGLLATGLGILANNTGHYGQFGPAVGAGGLAGLQTYQQANELKRKKALEEAQVAHMNMQNEVLKAQVEEKKRKDSTLKELEGVLSPKPTVTSTVNMSALPGALSGDYSGMLTNNTFTTPPVDMERARALYAQLNPGDALKSLFERKYHVVDGALVPEPASPDQQSKPVYEGKGKDEAAKINAYLDNAGITDPVERARYFKQMLDKQTTHQPAATTKVDLKVGEGVAKEIGPLLKESKISAEGASDTLDTVKRIRTAISKGKVIAGPYATFRLKGAQVGQLMGFGGKDTVETITNTRNVIKGLAQFALSNRKSLQGQGQITDREQALLQRAESGDIDEMTLEEIGVINDAAERTARKVFGRHKRTISNARAHPGAAPLADFFDVPDPDSGGWGMREIPK